jgi:glycosyltransferase involved in cell wall biosynthesis
LAIDVAEIAGYPIVVAGSGPLAAAIKSRAANAATNVVVCESPTREVVRALLQASSALLFPTHEDFGIVPVEAMAAGTPVVAFDAGGATETVIQGLTGVLVSEHRAEAYAEAIPYTLSLDAEDCRARAEQFAGSVFDRAITSWVDDETTSI